MTTRSGIHPPSTFAMMRGNFWLLFGAIFLVAGVMMSVVGAGMTWQEGRYASEGRTVPATVLGKSIDPGDADEGTQYFVRYRFTDLDGDVHDGSYQVPFDVYDAAREGQPIEVEYLAGDPGQNRVAGGSTLPGWVFLLVAGVALVIGGATALNGLRGFRHARRMWRQGRPATAEVIGIDETNVRINRRQMFRLRYRYTDASGTAYEGSSAYMPFSEAQDAANHVRGAVMYDPNRPADSIWVGREATTPE